MLIYRQNIFDVLMEYEKGEFGYSFKSESGERVENVNDVKISTYSYLESPKKAGINFSKYNLESFTSLVNFIKKYISDIKLEFSSYLYARTEKLIINNIQDIRRYSFLKIVFQKMDNFIVEEIPITCDDFENLEDKIISVINKNKHFLKFNGLNKTHKIYKDLPVVFSSKAAGYLVHEILGHTVEEDIYKSYYDKYKDLKFDSRLTVKDDPNVASGINGVGRFDDTGNLNFALTLIQSGKVFNIISLRQNDSKDKVLHGCARRENYKFDVLPRMRCTYVEPFGDMDEEKIASRYKKFIFLDQVHSGFLDPQSGNFQLDGVGFLKIDGEIQSFIGNLKLSGNLFINFNTIEYIGNNLNFFGGYCFKMGQSARVAIGAPSMSMYGIVVEGDSYV